MNGLLNAIGGRKLFLVVLGIVLLILNKSMDLGLSEDHLMYLVLGGAGAVALEDGLRGLGKGTYKKKK